ncbi:Zinc finger protein 862, partial [Dissostichus eleginoides]
SARGAFLHVMTPTRNRLRARSLNALLFVDLNGPPINKFDPFPFIQSWINKGHRTSTSWVPGPRPQSAENRPLIPPLFYLRNVQEEQEVLALQSPVTGEDGD